MHHHQRVGQLGPHEPGHPGRAATSSGIPSSCRSGFPRTRRSAWAARGRVRDRAGATTPATTPSPSSRRWIGPTSRSPSLMRPWGRNAIPRPGVPIRRTVLSVPWMRKVTPLFNSFKPVNIAAAQTADNSDVLAIVQGQAAGSFNGVSRRRTSRPWRTWRGRSSTVDWTVPAMPKEGRRLPSHIHAGVGDPARHGLPAGHPEVFHGAPGRPGAFVGQGQGLRDGGALRKSGLSHAGSRHRAGAAPAARPTRTSRTFPGKSHAVPVHQAPRPDPGLASAGRCASGRAGALCPAG